MQPHLYANAPFFPILETLWNYSSLVGSKLSLKKIEKAEILSIFDFLKYTLVGSASQNNVAVLATEM